MRNTHTIMLLAASSLLAAQKGTAQTPARNAKHPFVTTGAHNRAALAERSDAITLWTENFEDGLNGWTVETPYGNVGWELTSTGNTEGYTPGPLEGTSGYPGGHWIVADSDAGGTAGTPENTRITSPPIIGYGSAAPDGQVNAVVRSDIKVEAVKLTEATIEHHAAELTIKLVRSLPVGGLHWRPSTRKRVALAALS